MAGLPAGKTSPRGEEHRFGAREMTVGTSHPHTSKAGPETVSEQTWRCAGKGEPILLEAFVPEIGAGARPGVILLHGRDGPNSPVGDRTHRDLARSIATRGFVAVLPHYFDRTAGRAEGNDPGELGRFGWEIEQFGIWIETVGEVLEDVASRSVIDPMRLGCLGFSLGAYLALTVGMTGGRVRAVVEWSGGVPTPFAPSARRLPPTLVLHGDSDDVVAVSEAHALIKLLRYHRIAHDMRIYPGAGHGFTGADAADALERTVAFLEDSLSGAGLSPSAMIQKSWFRFRFGRRGRA